MIIVENICKKVPNGDIETEILKDVNFSINDNEFLAIMGPSGCGKSTLLGIMSGLDKPSQGQIIINVQSLYKLSYSELARFRNEHFGIVFQKFNLISNMSAIENVEVPLLLSKNSKNSTKKAKEMLQLVGLENKGNLIPAKLSGGEQQRVAIARAIVQNPSILFADEPTGSLDFENSQQIIGMFKELQKNLNITIVMVSHDLNISEKADRIIKMLDGKVQ